MGRTCVGLPASVQVVSGRRVRRSLPSSSLVEHLISARTRPPTCIVPILNCVTGGRENDDYCTQQRVPAKCQLPRRSKGAGSLLCACPAVAVACRRSSPLASVIHLSLVIGGPRPLTKHTGLELRLGHSALAQDQASWGRAASNHGC